MTDKTKEALRRFFSRLGQELMPDRYTCIVCGNELMEPCREGTCPTCLVHLPFVGEAVCLKCGKPILPEGSAAPLSVEPRDTECTSLDEDEEWGEPLVEVADGTYCRLCRRTERRFDQAVSPLAYCDSAQRLIYRLKYGDAAYLARYLSAFAADAYVKVAWEVDLVVAVPLYPARRRERGYNQSDHLARAFSRRLQLPYDARAVRKIRATPQQTHLGPKERLENLKGAFACDKERVKGKRVLVIDDVLTTGSTLDAVADTLKKAGALRVYGVTVANVPEH